MIEISENELVVFPIFELSFFGCRGSTPVSGSHVLRYGGNTTCIALQADEQLLIVDCGTGLAPLQAALFNTGRFSSAHIFLTHFHWDHIQGIPFFIPLFSPKNRFVVYGESRLGRSLRDQLAQSMAPPLFPVLPDAFHAEIDYRDIKCGDTLTVGNVLVRTCRLRHPNTCTGYRFEFEGKSVCIVGDFEHGEDGPVEFALDADVLIYDAQYTEEEYPSKVGFGHSTWREACAFAQKCGAKQLIMTHHDPWRSDDALDAIGRQARTLFPSSCCAAEGMKIVL